MASQNHTKKQDFITTLNQGYQFSSSTLLIGDAIYNGKVLPAVPIKLGLATLNRHGLIAGATGTGKTRTLQKLVEQLSINGCSMLVLDVKGDLSGLAMPGADDPKIRDRQQQLELPWHPEGFPVEFFTISNLTGIRLRSTISAFGSILFSRVLEANDIQTSVISLIFKYCEDKNIPLIDLKDMKKVLLYFSQEGKQDIAAEYGSIKPATVQAIFRKITELEEQGANSFFGEKAFEVTDLVHTDEVGKGYINILRVVDIQDKPKLFSTFMISLLTQIYRKFPEEGDLPKPKLCLFIDEAHLIFNRISKVLLDQIETTIKLIRSKGVGVYFITQNPIDIPASVLSQLGMKVQHALRAFTAKDRKAIKLAAENYPESSFYEVPDLLTSLGIGEALVTALNEKGIPTPLAQVLLAAPQSQFKPLFEEQIAKMVASSKLAIKYNQTIETESAYEIFSAKSTEKESTSAPTPKDKKSSKTPEGVWGQLEKSTLLRQMGRTFTKELTRWLLELLGIKKGKK